MIAQNATARSYRVALIGYGIGGAVFHAPLISSVPGLSLSAVVTRSDEKIRQVQRHFPAVKVVTSADQIFATAGDYDLVVVTSPNGLHFSQAKAALEAGLHVVIDKPMATSSFDCAELITLAKKQKLMLTVFQNRRFDGDFLTIQKILQDNLLGKVVRFESRFDRYRPQAKVGAWRELGTQAEGGGLLFDLGSHLVDQAINLFGKPSHIYCELDKRRPSVETDDDCFISLSFDSGVRAQLWASVLCRIKGPRLKLVGHAGSFEKYGLDPQEGALRAGLRPGPPIDVSDWGKEDEKNWGDIHTSVGDLVVKGKIETLPGDYQKFYREVLAALRSAQYDLAPVAAEDAWLTTKVLEAAFKSAEEKSVVALH